MTCVAALSQLSTSAAPPDRELPRSLPPTRITRALSRAHKAHSPCDRAHQAHIRPPDLGYWHNMKFEK